MPFRFRARYALFTYAQCGSLDPHEVVCLFSSLGAECIIGREHHADEGIHLHAFVDFGKRYDTSDQRRFDVDGRHPNIAPSQRTPEKMYDYAIKDGDVVGGGLERPVRSGVSETVDVWRQIADAEDRDSFWELVRELAPRALLTNFTSLRNYAEWHYRPERTPYSTPEGVTFDLSRVEGLSEWVCDNLSRDNVGKSYTSAKWTPVQLRRRRRPQEQPCTCIHEAMVRLFQNLSYPSGGSIRIRIRMLTNHRETERARVVGGHPTGQDTVGSQPRPTSVFRRVIQHVRSRRNTR